MFRAWNSLGDWVGGQYQYLDHTWSITHLFDPNTTNNTIAILRGLDSFLVLRSLRDLRPQHNR